MDRLLCGDVGFGKTEVVMRAAFKALGDGKQVAVLAPTTVLAFQHFETFKRRFQPFPVRVEMFSRFRSPKELKAVAGGPGGGQGRYRDRHPPPALEGRRVPGPRPGDRGRGAALRRPAQGAAEAAQEVGGRDQHERHAHPANTTYVVVGLARHVRDRNAAQGPAGDSHRGGALSARTDPVRRSSWSWAAAGRSTSCTTAWIPSGRGRP